MRYLAQMGLELAGDQDIMIQLPARDTWVKSIARIDYELEAELNSRKRRFQRGVALELVRLVAYAIQISTNRDLALIEEMMQRRDREALSPQSPEQA